VRSESFVLPMKFALALTLFLLASCASFRPAAQDSLVGEWKYADDTQSCRYAFQRDGSFSGEVNYRAKLVSKFTGRWAVKGDVLSYNYISDVLGRIPPGAIDHDKLLRVQKDSFLIQAADGSQRRYLRIH
jgi:hypothetical protein